MPQNTFNFTADAGSLKPVVWRSQPVYKNYSKLKNYLRQHLGESFASLFAEPVIFENIPGTISKASWRCENFTEIPIPLPNLPTSEQVDYRLLLSQMINRLLQHSQQMLESEEGDDVAWGQLINKVLEIPGEINIVCGEKKISIIAWGFQATEASDLPYSLRKNINPSNSGLQIAVEQFFSTDPEKAVTTFDRQDDTGLAKPKSESAENSNMRGETKQHSEVEEIGSDKDNSGLLPLKHKPPIPPGNNDTGQRSWWSRFWWLWLLLLLLILFGIFRQFKSESDLPARPGIIIPIDSTKVGLDPDSVRFIANDRLNIALIGDNKSLEAFAKRFKDLYPEKDIRIIYYDTATYRLQLEIPPAKLGTIRQALPVQMQEFKMLIWYEGIFESRQLPNDPGFSVVEDYWYHIAVQSPEAWKYTRGDSNLIIAIIDNGFDLNHPEFSGRIVSPWNVPAHSANVSTVLKDGVHGTHVAGIALGAANNGAGVSGIAPSCLFMPIQVGDNFGRMGSTAIIDGMLYAINHGATVINMSLGMSVPPEVAKMSPAYQRQLVGTLFKGEEEFWNSLFKMAQEKNITVVLAAGNDNVYIGLDPMQRSENTIVVSAVDENNSKATFSNYGVTSTLSAPGVHIYSSLPGRQFGFLDGTSMAAPIVTGGVALLKSVNPTLTLKQIKDIFQQTGLRVNTPVSAPMGNLIQLGSAVATATKARNGAPIASCPDVQQKIDSLLLEVEKLRQLCNDANTGDTLKLPPVNKENNLSFTEGRWKSTSDILNDDGSFVQLYFDFAGNGSGQITLVEENGTQCTAPLGLTLTSNQLSISQQSPAMCIPPPKRYAVYRFVCKADVNGRALCSAQNQNNSGNNFNFNLVKIK